MRSTKAPRQLPISPRWKSVHEDNKGDRWAQQWSTQYICSKDTGPGILIKKLIFKYRSHEEQDENGKDSTTIDMELNKWYLVSYLKKKKENQEVIATAAAKQS